MRSNMGATFSYALEPSVMHRWVRAARNGEHCALAARCECQRAAAQRER